MQVIKDVGCLLGISLATDFFLDEAISYHAKSLTNQTLPGLSGENDPVRLPVAPEASQRLRRQRSLRLRRRRHSTSADRRRTRRRRRTSHSPVRAILKHYLQFPGIANKAPLPLCKIKFEICFWRQNYFSKFSDGPQEEQKQKVDSE